MRSRSIYGVVFILIYGMNCIHCEELPIAGKVFISHVEMCLCGMVSAILIFGMLYIFSGLTGD